MFSLVSPVTLADIGSFMQNVFTGFESMVFLSFVLMSTFTVVLGIKRLFVGG